MDVLKAILGQCNCCVIMLTSVRDPQTVSACLDAGAAHYMLKDTGVAEMKKMIDSTFKTYYGEQD